MTAGRARSTSGNAPGRRSFALRAGLAGGRFADKAALAEALRGDPKRAAAQVGEALDNAAETRRLTAHYDEARPARLLLAVDQAERLFAEAPKDADDFGELLRTLAEPTAYVVVVMRADVYARFQACAPLLALRTAGAPFDLLPPTAAEREEIVEKSVMACAPPLKFDPNDPTLAQRRVADAKGGDALPLLQMTLEGLYKAQLARGDGVLRPEDYKGMAAAVTEAANAPVAHQEESGRRALKALGRRPGRRPRAGPYHRRTEARRCRGRPRRLRQGYGRTRGAHRRLRRSGS